MPTKPTYVKPEVFMRYKGITIYHTYEFGELSERNTNYFSTTIEGADDDNTADTFDVRELTTWVEPPHPPFKGIRKSKKLDAAWKKYHDDKVMEKAMKSAIKNAINLGGEKQLHTT